MKFGKLVLLMLLILIALSFQSCDLLSLGDKVATPTFSPAGGSYASEQTVTISCSTPDATIHYTTDGSTPTESSTQYTSPLLVTSNTTIKAKGFLTDWKDSAVASVNYTIEQAPTDMTLVSGGTFTMGDTRGTGYTDELPLHSVTLSAFYMGKYEVTQKEWIETMGYNPAHDNGVGDMYPVYYVTWLDALKYCNKRSIAEALAPVYTINGSTDPNTWGDTIPGAPTLNPVVCNWNANGYRLPTEAEWEYAARGGTNTPDYQYSGSDDVDGVATYATATHSQVGMKSPNGLGLYDMSGNVYEYCWDVYVQNYYAFSPGDNPTGPANTYYSGIRVKRGGAFCFTANECTVSHRESINHYGGNGGGHYSLGFRVCRSSM
jgi:formylglycine-generating enzyme